MSEVQHVDLEMTSPYWHGVYRTLKGPDGGIIPRRMSAEQEKWFLSRPPEQSHWYGRCITAAGCRILVAGQIRRFCFSAHHVSQCRPFFGYDLTTPEGFCRSFSKQTPQEEFSIDQELPEGTTGVALYLPYQAEVEVVRCTVSAKGGISPMNVNGPKMLFFGDSITQGWEAVNPGDSYAARTADALRCDYCNLSVAGTVMNSENIAFAGVHSWDRAVLAFGVNDAAWNIPAEKFASEAKKSISFLASRAGCGVIVISPIWWPAAEKEGKLELLQANRKTLFELCCRIPGTKFVDGKSLIPADRKYFADQVHPNPAGMACMAGNLLKLLTA